jgi:hypothetical protein
MYDLTWWDATRMTRITRIGRVYTGILPVFIRQIRVIRVELTAIKMLADALVVMQLTKNIFIFFQRSIWYLPLLSTLIFATYFLLCANQLGHTPVYNKDPYGQISWLYHLTLWLMNFGFFAAVFCLVYLVLKIFIRKMPVYKYDIIFLCLGIVLYVSMMNSDGIEWMLD